MVSFYLVWCVSYLVVLVLLAKKWSIEQVQTGFGNKNTRKVSLLIPFRNEATIAADLIHELKKLHNPELEIILIDDQSEDESFTLFEEYSRLDSRVRVLKSPGFGKKAALEFGVKIASGEIILCTDADCRFPPNWVERMLEPFKDQQIQLVAGPVISEVKKPGFFSRFQQIEWSSILLLTQYFFSIQKPLMCSAANMAYRKSAFERVKGYQGNSHILSGDDEFLLKKIHSVYGKGSSIYLSYRQSLVFTRAQVGLKELLNQRIRWAGKWRSHRSFIHAATALFMVFVQLVWLESIYIFAFNKATLVFLAWIWSMKIFSEKLALGKVLKSLGQKTPTLDFMVTGFFHPIYVLMVSLGTVFGKFSWKGRSN
ncbi:glycosyltransferase [Algoriphagus sp. CAU 1675]|uniref:glycosyltransferase n=1 Tax=Algoriphagus sp. CAU 1675 TaxID=3032597 RepID=UPI0023DBFE7C|nr:glycosyltransferase [Algoriphagus sp. CAU 1675]MDF2157538.1 glycosyltransferase [Algoriphagus sp. CAU 1675]